MADATSMPRRAFLKAIPAAGAALSVPAGANANEKETPIIRLFRQHDAIHRAMNCRLHKRTDEECYALNEQMMDIEEEMAKTPCVTLADHAAKMVAIIGRDGGFSDWEDDAIWKEARELIGAELGVSPEVLL